VYCKLTKITGEHQFAISVINEGMKHECWLANLSKTKTPVLISSLLFQSTPHIVKFALESCAA
jgi:hypothetical protein